MNAIEIKHADHQDLELLALLGRVTWAETFGTLFQREKDVKDYVDTNFSISAIKSYLENPNTYFWLAYYNGFPVGYAKIENHVKTELVQGTKVCKLRNIYVLKDFHSKKIGLALWSIMLEKVKELQCDKIWLAVLHTNDKAIKFYKDNEFYTVGDFNLNIGIDSFIMNIMVRECH
ncbi:GNAT family N-acetyltransferase [Geojedonia litorea]|uniref:GNAT family N-acetyltransferase n=1 Tax=Geojedonia litorea TaxID=1268269 RepID=A0ABV9N2Z3_9FLAO